MSDRAQRLTELLPDAEVDAVLISDLVNVRYITGFTGSNGLALVGPNIRKFFTDFRYVTQAATEVDPTFEHAPASRDLFDAVGRELPEGPLRLGFEDGHISMRVHARLRELLPERVELVAAGGLVERLRAVKEPGELELIKAAAAIADASFGQLVSDGLLGRTEIELATWLEHDMRRRGARRPAFDSVVAAGSHGALPHATPRDVEVRRGDLVVVDWGAQVDGYCSDCTRTVAVGEPGAQAREVYALVLDAQETGVRAVATGAAARAVDGAARAVIVAAGHGDEFGHGLGHGVGLDVHEAPRLTQTSDDQLVSGNVVTVEPGIYLPHHFGVRIEDLVAVRDGDCEVFTSVSKALTVVD